jgi:hypothetical protein
MSDEEEKYEWYEGTLLGVRKEEDGCLTLIFAGKYDPADLVNKDMEAYKTIRVLEDNIRWYMKSENMIVQVEIRSLGAAILEERKVKITGQGDRIKQYLHYLGFSLM